MVKIVRIEIGLILFAGDLRQRRVRGLSRVANASRRLSTALMNFASEFFVKLRFLLLTALMRVPSTASSSRPKRLSSPAQQRELMEHGAEGGSIVAPEVGNGLEVWLQGSQQPDDLDIAVAFGLKPPA